MGEFEVQNASYKTVMRQVGEGKTDDVVVPNADSQCL